MKEEKRKSMLTMLLAPRSGPPLLNNDRKQNGQAPDFAKFNNYSEQSSAAQKFMRVVKRIGTKPTISSFHAQLSEPKNNIPRDANNLSTGMVGQVKGDKQNGQAKEMRRKLKRVGKKVWVTAYKQNIGQLQQTSQIINKQQANNQSESGKYQYRQFEEGNKTAHRTQGEQNQNAPHFDKPSRQQDTQQPIKNGRFTVNQSLAKKQASRISEPDFKKGKPRRSGENERKNQLSDSQRSENISETHNIPITEEQQLEISIESKNQLDDGPETPDVDIDRMLEQIQIDQAINKSTHKSPNSESSTKRKSVKNTRKSSRFSNKPNDNQASNTVEIKAKRPKGRESTFKAEENKSRETTISRGSNAQKTTKRQSNFQQSVSTNQKSLKKPLPPAYPFSQEKAKSILSSDNEDVSNISSKQKVRPFLSKQSSIHSAQSSMTGSKIELERVQLRELRRETPLRQRETESYHSLHYSQKKQGTRKIGIQKFKNVEAVEENRITSSLKKNKNLEMNRYVAEARKEVITDSLFRQTGYCI